MVQAEEPATRRPARAVVVLAVLAVLLAAPGSANPVAEPVPGESVRPVPGEVTGAFDPPSQPYGPGRRGVRLQARPGEPVRAARSGRVAFAGPVAGTPWVSIDHDGGLRTSYGPVEARVAVGDRVRAGALIGRTPAAGAGEAGLHWGARVDGVYIDPLDLLRSWRPTLLPRAAG